MAIGAAGRSQAMRLQTGCARPGQQHSVHPLHRASLPTSRCWVQVWSRRNETGGLQPARTAQPASRNGESVPIKAKTSLPASQVSLPPSAIHPANTDGGQATEEAGRAAMASPEEEEQEEGEEEENHDEVMKQRLELGKAQELRRYVGVQRYRMKTKDGWKDIGWRTSIRIKGLGAVVWLATHPEGRTREAARAYDAACYLRDGGRGVKNFPNEYENLTAEQGTALAKKVLGVVATQKMMEALDSRDKGVAETSSLSTLDASQPTLDTTKPILDTTLDATKVQPRMQKTSASPGVRMIMSSWAAQIEVKRRSVHLGTHATEEGAQRAYASAWFLRSVYLGKAQRKRGPRARGPPPFCEEFAALPQTQGIAKAQRWLEAVESCPGIRPYAALMAALQKAVPTVQQAAAVPSSDDALLSSSSDGAA